MSDDAAAPPDEVTRDRFLVWRAPRPGRFNPERMTNPVWRWLAARPELSAYQANQIFDGPPSHEVGPCWCGQRFGQSLTALPDGRTVAIGGEHEDHYDPDFHIYNDVIVREPDGAIEIYGYPTEVFPPTDFHSATRVDDRVVLIGSLGYPASRRPEVTPLAVLSLDRLAISRPDAGGAPPGWISSHQAELDDGAIVVRGGQRIVELGERQRLLTCVDEWSLELAGWRWTRLTARPVEEWSLARDDGEASALWILRSAHAIGDRDFLRPQLDELAARLGGPPDVAAYGQLYRPPLDHVRLPQADDDLAIRLEIPGGTVRYREDGLGVTVLIEGGPGPAAVAALLDDLETKLRAIERAPYRRTRLQ